MSTGGLSPQSPSSPTHMPAGIIAQPRVTVQTVSVPKVSSSPVTSIPPQQRVEVASRITQSTAKAAIKGTITTNTRARRKVNDSISASANPNITTNANTMPKRTAYKQPLTQEQKDLINAAKAPLPLSEEHAAFDNSVHGLCSNEACKSAAEAWWSGLTSTQLVSVSDFKQQVQQINACSKCSNSKNTPKILQSMSQFQSILAINTYKRSVPLFEIRRKQT